MYYNVCPHSTRLFGYCVKTVDVILFVNPTEALGFLVLYIHTIDLTGAD